MKSFSGILPSISNFSLSGCWLAISCNNIIALSSTISCWRFCIKNCFINSKSESVGATPISSVYSLSTPMYLYLLCFLSCKKKLQNLIKSLFVMLAQTPSLISIAHSFSEICWTFNLTSTR